MGYAHGLDKTSYFEIKFFAKAKKKSNPIHLECYLYKDS
jgi:hypothetical protein